MRITQQELKTAYQIVTADFLKKIKSAQDGQGIRISDWGTFIKTSQKVKGWSGKDKKARQTYTYWKISFRVAPALKKVLDK